MNEPGGEVWSQAAGTTHLHPASKKNANATWELFAVKGLQGFPRIVGREMPLRGFLEVYTEECPLGRIPENS